MTVKFLSRELPSIYHFNLTAPGCRACRPTWHSDFRQPQQLASFVFSPVVTGTLRGGGGGGRDGGGQNLGLRVEKREGGVRETEKRAARKS